MSRFVWAHDLCEGPLHAVLESQLMTGQGAWCGCQPAYAWMAAWRDDLRSMGKCPGCAGATRGLVDDTLRGIVETDEFIRRHNPLRGP